MKVYYVYHLEPYESEDIIGIFDNKMEAEKAKNFFIDSKYPKWEYKNISILEIELNKNYSID